MKKIVFTCIFFFCFYANAQELAIDCESSIDNSTSYDFGTVPIGESRTIECTFRNHWNVDVEVQGGFWNSSGDDFTQAITGCQSVVLQPNGTCTKVFTFTPINKYPTGRGYTVSYWNPSIFNYVYAYIDFFGNGEEAPIEPSSCPVRLPKTNISLDSQGLDQSIPISGTGYALNYSSRYSVVSARRSGKVFSGREQGWGPSSVHYFNVLESRLVRGSGSDYVVDYETLSNGEIRINDGAEIYTFDPNGRHINSRSPLTGIITQHNTYNLAGELVSIKDAYLNETVFNRDVSGRLVSIASPYGQVTSIFYNSQGLISAIRNANLETTSFEYFPSTSKISRVIRPTGRFVEFDYDSNGFLSKSMKSGISGVTMTRIASHKAAEISSTTALGRQSSFSISRKNDQNSYTRAETTPSGFKKTYKEIGKFFSIKSSVLGSTEVVTVPDERFPALAKRVSSVKQSLGSKNRMVKFDRSIYGATSDPFVFSSVVDSLNVNGAVSTSTFNRASKTFTQVSAEGVVVTQKMNEFEKVTEIKVNNDAPLKLAYNSRGQLNSIQQGVNPASSIDYDLKGRIQKTKNSRGEEYLYNYDEVGRLTSRTAPDLSVTLFGYDQDGNLTQVKPPDRLAHTIRFDPLGLFSSYESPSVLAPAKVTKYKYNNDGQLILVRKPDYPEVKINYSEQSGLLTSISSGNYSQTMSYISGDRVDFVKSFDGVMSSFFYEGPIRVSEAQEINGDASHSSRIRFILGDNFLPKTRFLNSTFLGGTQRADYKYSLDDQVTRVGDLGIQYESGTGRLQQLSLEKVLDNRQYDQFGNLHTYSANYHQAGVTNELYSYVLSRDSMGRIVGIDEVIMGQASSLAYSYDSVGRLIQVRKNNVIVEEYQYDGNSNRVYSKVNSSVRVATFDHEDRILTQGSTVFGNNSNGDVVSVEESLMNPRKIQWDLLGRLRGVKLSDGAQIEYVLDWDGRRVGKRRNGVSEERRIFESKSRIAALFEEKTRKVKTFFYAANVNSPDYMQVDGVNYRIIKNHLGSPRLVVRASDGVVVQRIEYSTWGEVLQDTNPGFQPYGFAGGLYDRDTRLTQFESREYSAEVGRWFSKDPILFNGGDANLYAYVGNDPVNFIDPSGLTKEDLYIALGWLGANHPAIFENINPSYILIKNLQLKTGNFGYTLSKNLIVLDEGLLDAGTCEGSAERIAAYVSAVYHELAHAEDIFRVGPLEFFTSEYYGRTDPLSRHDEIYTRAAIIRDQYLKGK